MNAPVPRANVTLDDKFNVQSGWIYLTGTQALTRLPIQQAIRDKAAGLNTGGFISGYRGSPLGRYDVELWAKKKLLERHNIHFMPGINEDLSRRTARRSRPRSRSQRKRSNHALNC